MHVYVLWYMYTKYLSANLWSRYDIPLSSRPHCMTVLQPGDATTMAWLPHSLMDSAVSFTIIM